MGIWARPFQRGHAKLRILSINKLKLSTCRFLSRLTIFNFSKLKILPFYIDVNMTKNSTQVWWAYWSSKILAQKQLSLFGAKWCSINGDILFISKVIHITNIYTQTHKAACVDQIMQRTKVAPRHFSTPSLDRSAILRVKAGQLINIKHCLIYNLNVENYKIYIYVQKLN